MKLAWKQWNIISIFILILFLGLASLCEAQNIDSLKTSLRNGAEYDAALEAIAFINDEIGWEQPDTFLRYINLLLSDVRYKEDLKAQAALQYYFGRAHRAKGEFPVSIEYFKRSYELADQAGDSIRLGDAYLQNGLVNLFSGNLNQSLESMKQSLAIAEALKDQGRIANVNNGLASYYLDADNTDEALIRYKLALETFEAINDTNGRANVHANLGLTYIDLGEYKLAEYNLHQQGYLDSLLKSDWGLGFHYDFMGYLRQEEKKWEEALVWHHRGLKLRKKAASTINVGESRMSISGLYVKIKDYEQAIHYANLVLSTSLKNGSLYQQQAAYDYLAQSYEALNQPALALQNHKKYKITTDSIYQKSKSESLAENEALLKKSAQDGEIALLNTQNELKARQLTQQKWYVSILSFAALILFGVLYALYRLYHQLQEKNTLIEESLLEKETLLKEIHHRVKNNLQVVSSLISMQSRRADNPEVTKAFKEARDRIHSMALIHQDLYESNNLSKVNINTYLEKLIKDLFTNYNASQDDIGLDLKIDDMTLDLDIMIPLGLIISELISNSLKHAFKEGQKGQIKVQLNEINNHLKLTVSDNGIGITAEKMSASNSMGSKLIQAFAKKLKANYNIASINGTTTTLIINNFKNLSYV